MMADGTDKNPAEQIRAEYVETLKRWYASHEGCTAVGCDECDTTVESAVAALAEAGLLPTEMQQHGTYRDNGRYDWRPTERRYLTGWRQVPE